jgi:hypothetical protein
MCEAEKTLEVDQAQGKLRPRVRARIPQPHWIPPGADLDASALAVSSAGTWAARGGSVAGCVAAACCWSVVAEADSFGDAEVGSGAGVSASGYALVSSCKTP